LIPEGFQNYFLNVSRTTGEVSSAYWPSFALLLAPFTLLGIPWACNPVLSGLTIVVLNRLARRLFADVVGSVALTLHNPVPHLLFSLPWFVWLARRERPVAKLATLWAGYLPLSIVLGIGWFIHSGTLSHAGEAVAAGA